MSAFAPVKGLTRDEIDSLVTSILAEATLDEKCAMMAGRGNMQRWAETKGLWGAVPYHAGGGCERLGVPSLWFTDGPRGVARGQSTCFPCTMARGASFDVDLERRIGEAMGIEARAQDCNLSGAVCMNLLRHPAWGRAQETYGEDPHHLGAMAVALASGIQTHNVIATAKHFALNSMENARFKVDVRIDGRSLREVYLPHFKMVIDAGVGSVMSAYNKMNAEYCGQHRELLTDILRGEWGFEGFVHSDWIKGVYRLRGASAGLDIEMPEMVVFRSLPGAVRAGQIEPQVIDTACRRILTTLYRFACAEDPLPEYPMALVAGPAHVALAREAAEKSAVLLTNDGTLPLVKAKVKRLAVLGRLADLINTGDRGSSQVRAPHVVTALDGLMRYLGDATEIVRGDEGDADAAADAARNADAAIVVVGLTHLEEGEFISGDINFGDADGNAAAGPTARADRGGDRDDLGLPADQIALIEAVAATGVPTIVVIVAGSAVMVEGWHDKAAAILQTFYSGMEGGTALARLLFGAVSPSGRLPFTVARDATHYPFFDKNAESIEYGPYNGYTLFEREGTAPRFGFGHGLSYARFEARAATLRRAGDALHGTISIANTGPCAGAEIVRLFIEIPWQGDGPNRLLKAFARVALEPGERRTVDLRVPLDALRQYDPDVPAWLLNPGRYRAIFVAAEREQVVTVSL